jgi:ribonucleoside-triphosphate reductase
MIIKNFLLATEKGLGNGETPIFPISIFKLKAGVNKLKTDPGYHLFKLACRVSAKRLFPNFSFLDAPHNAQYYKPGRPETEVAYMGCVVAKETITVNIEDITYSDASITLLYPKCIR